MKLKTLFLLLTCCSQTLLAQNDSTKTYTTAWVQGEPPHIDGSQNDPAWEQVAWGGGDFRQIQPDKGKPASVETRFKILYDAKNLYVLIRAFDPEPKKIVRRMSRRDSFEGDLLEINIDSYYDKRTAFSFTASASGVKGDEYVSNNGDEWDEGWDPIWYLKTSIDDQGWLAEMRIPLSQLRFADLPELTWGIQIMRVYFKKQERSLWQYIPPDAAGYVHLFGEMKGIKGIKPQKQLEVQPYVVTQTETLQKEEGNPYQTGKSSGANLGLDAKIGLTSDITLDLTMNPDFGQVEADPSQVNLSAFELFFQERRPFFLEGANTLSFPVSLFNSNALFYSRRIGRPPQGFVNTDESGEDGVPEFVKPNNRTTILGAAKITGKNKKGFSWGILETITPKESAEVDSLGFKRKEAVEPMTNYFVSRAQQDINKGNTIIGAMLTATNRRIEDKQLMWLHDAAYSGGIDLVHHWKKREYYVSAKSVLSHVQGSKEAIGTTQLSSERFFQRPDNHHTEFDPDRTSLTGTGGTVIVGKKSGNIITDLGVTWSSPELELNDIGFLSQTDNVTQWFWMQYRILSPKGVTNWQRYNINEFKEWDFGGRNLSSGYNVNAHWQFKNFYRFGGGFSYQTHNMSNADLRGGPAIRYPGSIFYWIYTGTDPRKKLYASVESQFSRGFENYSDNTNVDLEVTYQPINAMKLAVSSSFSRNNNQMQYVASGEVTDGNRYVVGEIDQTTFRISIRATFMITPNLSVQYWGQPFGTTGKYNNFKYVTDARADSYTNRFMNVPASWLTSTADEYFVDEDSNGITDYGFMKPDFNFAQFRSNMVIRWEYIPGSTVFLVWTKERNGAFYENTGPVHERYNFDFNQKGHNIFLMKFTYRFVL